MTMIMTYLLFHVFVGLKAAFDEKTLFPKFLLEYEQKMKQFHQQNLNPGVVSLI